MTTHFDDDIAIVGIACRYPGEAKDPNGLLDMLKNGRDAWGKVPKDRFDIDMYLHPSQERQGSIIADSGHFITEDVSLFDAPFFSMTTAEANAMDPQQRLLLETTYEAMENAGIPMEKLVGTDTSVYVGCFTHDYEAISARDVNNTLLYQATGQGLAMLSNRLSWFFDFKGPSLTLDTACSSSLLALHLACQSIRNGESTMSIVGGTGLILLPDMMRALTALHFLSPDSRCFSFDDRANGYARGEGTSTLVLKPVKDALRDGDTIRAVLRGVGSNQDGRTPGITLPSPEAQATLIAATYRKAGLPYSETQYFEAHGTGTPAGDPLELGALGATFGSESDKRDQPMYVGSVKTNIGHLEGCAGLAGLLKAILSLESGFIFPTLNFKNPNPKLKLTEWNLDIATKLTPWPTDGTRRVSVNSFGYGGSNVHAIVDDAYHYLQERGLQGFTNTNPRVPVLTPTTAATQDSAIGSDASTPTDDNNEYFPTISSGKSSQRLFVLSAPDQASLARLSATYSTYIEGKQQTKDEQKFLNNLAYTLACRRSKFLWKQATIGSSAEKLFTDIKSATPSRSKKTVRMAMVFTGQGAQWYAMGRELMSHEAYARSVRLADTYLKRLGATWSVIEELGAGEEESRINEAEFSQPLCTVLQVALVDLLSHWGISPAAVVGHSSGEIAAAYAAGSLSASDAWKIAYHRGRAAKRVAEVAPHLKGGMMAVGLGADKAQEYLASLKTTGTAVVACHNSPESVTISGDTDALDALETRLKADEVFNRRLKVVNAYHSPHMGYVEDEYRKSIATIKPHDSQTDCIFYSSVTGLAQPGSTLNADYWCDNMVRPVRFLQAVTAMLPDPQAKRRQRRKNAAATFDTFVEVGPSGALQGPLRQIMSARKDAAKANNAAEDITLLNTLSRNTSAVDTSLALVAKLWCMGLPGINLPHVNSISLAPVQRQSLCDTPTYAWNHTTRYWHEQAASRNHRFPKTPRLDVLGARDENWNPSEPTWYNTLRISELPWLKEHVVQGSIIFPAAGYISAVLEAGKQVADEQKVVKEYEFRDVSIGRALEFDGEMDVVPITTTLKPRKIGLKSREAPWWEFTLYSGGEKGHIEHCSGLLTIHYEHEASVIEGGMEELKRNEGLAKEYREILALSTKAVKPGDLYSKFDGIGLQYGPLFQGLTGVQGGKAGMGCTTVTVADTKSVMPMNFEYEHLLHPCTLDACFQSVLVAFNEQSGAKMQAMVPTSIESIKISAHLPKGAGSTLHGFAKGSKRGFRETLGSVCMSDETWAAPKIQISGFACTELGALTGGHASAQDAKAARHKVQSYWHWETDMILLTPELAQKRIGMSDDEFYSRPEEAHFSTQGERLAAVLGKRALRTLTPEIEEKLPSHLVFYVQWLREQYALAQKGGLALQKGNNEWITQSDEDDDKFIAETGPISIDTRLLAAIGKNVGGILDGSVAPLAVMMEDGMLLDFYCGAVGMDTANRHMANFFSLRGHKQPNMKILEVGGGTASISVPILKALTGPHEGATTRCSSYVFTDISSGFFEAAEKKLKQWSGIVKYQRLDIEQDPVEQGFELESFDVICASNVLHATKNINDTLQNVLKLLKPDGQLVLGEITMPRARVSMIMGVLSGWWLSEDGRTGGPCLSEGQWAKAFERNGFSFDYDVIDVPEQDYHVMSFLCGTKKVESSFPFSKAVIVDNGSPSAKVNSLAEGLVKSLKGQNIECSRVNINDVHAKEDETAEHPLAEHLAISLVETDTPFFLNLTEAQLKATQALLFNAGGTVWLTQSDRLGRSDPNFRMVDGVLRVLRNEEQKLRLHTLDLDDTLQPADEATSQCILDSVNAMFRKDKSVAETEFAYQDGELKIPRLYDDVSKNYDLQMLHKQRPPVMAPLKQEGRTLKLTIGVPGMLDTLHFVDDPDAEGPLQDGFVEFEVKTTALNFVDLMVSMGIVPDTVLGCDAAGVVTSVGAGVTDLKVGDRIACFFLGTYRNSVRCPASLCQKIPDELSFEDAATLPTIYATAYQSLVEMGRLQKGESILIHSAAGGLGQAAIQLAQYLGAEIFVTVGSPSKKELIMEAYGIPEDHIFNSRDLTFADAVLRSTNGKGVDVVLNSLAGEALRKTWTCIKAFGRFIEVGKKDILGNTGLEMQPFLRNVTFSGVNIEHMLRYSVEMTAEIGRKVFDLIRAGHVGVVKPITSYSMSEVEKAFRVMQQGKHTGKLVLTLDDDAEVPVVPRDPHPLRLSPNATYLLVGGLGGLGRAQALWMAKMGAKHLAFISRSGAASDAAKETMKQLKDLGVDARAYSCDIANRDALVTTLAVMADEMPRVQGVIQGAMVIADSFFANMGFDSWSKAIRPKVNGTWNLHDLLPRDLDFFIMLSSIAGICGIRGQSNYAAGNTYQDALAQHRHSLGLPATVLDLGLMAEFGYIEENRDNLQSVKNMATGLVSFLIEPDQFYSVLKSSMTGYTDGENRMPVHATVGAATGGMVLAANLQDEYDWYWHDDVKFNYLRHVDTLDLDTTGDEGDAQFKAALAAVTNLSGAVEVVQEALLAKLAKAMMLPLEDIDATKPISSYGVDSLVAVEVRNWIAREIKADLSVFDILSPIPATQLVHKIAAKSLLVKAEVRAEAAAEAGEDAPKEGQEAAGEAKAEAPAKAEE